MPTRRPTSHPNPIDSVIAEAATVIRSGGLVAFATETVYGLGADATNPLAVARIFEAKRRPSFDPLIVHAEDEAHARQCVTTWPVEARALAETFWPGPLTLVLPRATSVVPDIVAAGLPTVAVRVPDHPIALALIAASGTPIAAPSANLFGTVSPTTAGHVRESLGDRVDIVLDGGPCRAGVESTIISLVTGRAVLLRPGATPIEAVEETIGPIERPSAAPEGSARPEAPGMLSRHYATQTPLYFVGHAPESMIPERCGRLLLAPSAEPTQFGAMEVLSQDGSLREAAANLFAAMRRLDSQNLDAIIADEFPDAGLGVAINDRLRRAAAR